VSKAWSVNIHADVLTGTRQDAARGLLLAAKHILKVSNRDVPVESGELERSGDTSIDAEALRASVSYDTPYAVYEHEAMNLHHDDGGPKFLERALHSERGDVAKIIAREIRK
jgi:hypothetical protein